MFERLRGVIVVTIAALLLGFGLGRYTKATEPDASGTRTVPLEVLENHLAVVQPDRCEQYETAEGYRSVRVRGTVVENLGDDAQIIATEFRVFAGDGPNYVETDQEYGSIREWRVPVDEEIRDVVLTAEGHSQPQQIHGDVTRCILFIERKGTYLPPFEGPPPVGEGVSIGVQYDYRWFVHCGATMLQFDGRWWRPASPLGENPDGPPAGWDENDERGLIELRSEQRARFMTRGTSVDLVPTVAPTYNPFACE